MSANDAVLFISDLHLDPDRPDITRQFVDFIEARATRARALYILGDLFEAWLGDDDPASELEPALTPLRELTRHVPTCFIRGNRDFLVGDTLAARLGMQLLDEPCILNHANRRIALMHGDLLCTDDDAYQNFRQLVRGQAWQQDFLSKDLGERRAIANGLRKKSSQAMASKAEVIMDVNQHTVLDYFSRLDVDIIIHGHTHRPAVHDAGNGRKRYVLGDWNPDASFLSLDNDGEFVLHDPRVQA